MASEITPDNKNKEIAEPMVIENSAVLNFANPFGSNRNSNKKSNSDNYFAMPATGWNQGTLHNYNAVDIANNCGSPIYAAADGLVTESVNEGWNNGYGSYIKIEHQNNTETLYSHLEKITVSLGKYVHKKDVIGYMGNTDNTHGPTGCHLHFEVHGADNPLAKE